MSGFVAVLRQLLVATVGLAALFALAGFLAAHFGGWTSGTKGVGWGMVVGGALVGLVTGGSGSPTTMAREGMWGPFGTYWRQSAALPQSPLHLAFGSLFAFAGGLALLILA